MGQRLAELTTWVSRVGAKAGVVLQEGWQVLPVSGDASFRRYFRLVNGDQSWILVDAPPEKEALSPFVQIAQQWKAEGINVPEVVYVDFEHGFMLLSDFGDDLYLPALQQGRADDLYPQALSELIRIQRLNAQTLPLYDSALLQREMALFDEWFVQRLLKLTLSSSQRVMLNEVFRFLEADALAQPQVPVHRDYHSRNLMLVAGNRPGVIDFQDAVLGPITYDLVSLLKDCYIAWPRVRVERWCADYLERAKACEVIDREVDLAQLLRWFDLMGAQRHLKVLGIFSRLNIRDGKTGYMGDIPLVLDYLLSVAVVYPELAPLAVLINDTIKPAMRESGHFQGVSL